MCSSRTFSLLAVCGGVGVGVSVFSAALFLRRQTMQTRALLAVFSRITASPHFVFPLYARKHTHSTSICNMPASSLSVVHEVAYTLTPQSLTSNSHKNMKTESDFARTAEDRRFIAS